MIFKKTILFTFIFIISLGLFYATPQTTTSGNDNLWHNDDQVITLSCEDNNSDADINCSYIWYHFDDSDFNIQNTDNNDPFIVTFTISTDGNHQIDFNSTATDGNIEETQTIYVSIDKAEPVTTISGATSLTNQNANITFTCNDETGSDCNAIKYKIDDGNLTDYNSEIEIIISSEGSHSIEYYSLDNVGNEEDHKTATIKIDKTSPTLTTAKASNISTTSARLYIELNEDGSCRYSDDSDDDTYSEMTDTKSVDEDEETYWSLSGLNDDTDYDYYIICKDDAGNESSRKHIDFTTDRKSSSSSSSSGGSSSGDDSEMLITKPYTPLTDANISSLKTTLTQAGFDVTNKTLILNNSEIDIQRKIRGTIYDDKGNFVFTISIKNKTNKDKNISILEIVPKEVASNASKITFVTQPTKILKADPIVLWQVVVPANKDINISYKVYSITNSKVISSNQFLRNWQSPAGFTDNISAITPKVTTPALTEIACKDDNDSCTEEIIENNVCVHRNICEISGMTGEVTLPKKNGPINYMLLYIFGGIFAIAMIILGIYNISKNQNPMGYGFKHHVQGLFSNRRKRR